MTPALNDTTRKFWEFVFTKRAQYLFWCKTSGDMPRPELVGARRFGHFVRQPHGDSAYWGFKTRDDRDRFSAAYNGELWDPR